MTVTELRARHSLVAALAAVVSIFAAQAALAQATTLDLSPGGTPASSTTASVDPTPSTTTATHSTRGTAHRQKSALPAKRDPLVPDLSISVKDVPPAEVDLPGVLKLPGAAKKLLDPSRAKRVSCTNEGSETVFLSATEPNRIELPFVNPRVIGTDDLEIKKRPGSNNVYVTIVPGVTHAITLWIEPHSGSSLSCGLQVLPAKVPGQMILMVADAAAVAAGQSGVGQSASAESAAQGSDFLARVQTELQDALQGRAPAGWSTVNLAVPPIALDGVLVEGARRLSNVDEDIYVYTVVNPGVKDVLLDEAQFDGPSVEAVSILPAPLIHAGATTYVAVLAHKHALVDAPVAALAGGVR